MSEYITLLGAEDVQRAASSMSSSAETISRAASSMDETASQFLRRFEGLVCRLEDLQKKGEQNSP